jgi:hypothetical protein
MRCSDCSAEAETVEAPKSGPDFVPNATVTIANRRYLKMLLACLSRIPMNGSPIGLPTVIRDRKRGSLPGVVGLTKFSLKEYSSNRVQPDGGAQHTITFYTNLLDRLSDRAAMAVMAHELAHAWLNEHIRPEASKAREQDADMLAEMWGFEKELASLAAETDPVS